MRSGHVFDRLELQKLVIDTKNNGRQDKNMEMSNRKTKSRSAPIKSITESEAEDYSTSL